MFILNDLDLKKKKEVENFNMSKLNQEQLCCS